MKAYQKFLMEEKTDSPFKKFKSEFSPKALKTSAYWSLAFSPVLALALKTLAGSINHEVSLAQERCGSFNSGTGKKKCVAEQNIRIYSGMIRKLTELRSKCTNSECEEKIDKKIRNAKITVIMAHNTLKDAANEIKSAEEENKMDRKLYSKNLKEHSIPKKNKQVTEVQEGFVFGMTGSLGKMSGIVGGILAYVLVDKALQPVWKQLTNMMVEAEKKCKDFDGPAKDLCKSKYKLFVLKKKLNVLKTAQSRCNSRFGSDDGKCKQIISKIADTERQIKVFTDNIQIYEQAMRKGLAERTAAGTMLKNE